MQTGRVCLFIAFAGLTSGAAEATEIADDLSQGQALQSQGRLAEAREQFRVALSKATAIPEQPELQVSALSNLASVEIDLAHPERAAELYNSAIKLLQNSRGEHASAIERLRIHLAELYLENGEFVTAERLVKGVMARGSAAAPEAAFADDVLACIYAHQKKLREAEISERQALSVLERIGRTEQPEYAVAMLHFGTFLNLGKHPADSLPYLQRALAILRSLPVRQPAMEGSAEIAIASVYSFLGRGEEALHFAEDARRTVVTYYGAEHPGTGAILLAEAAVLRKLGEKAAARRVQVEGERIMAGKPHTGIGATVPLQALLPEKR